MYFSTKPPTISKISFVSELSIPCLLHSGSHCVHYLREYIFQLLQPTVHTKSLCRLESGLSPEYYQPPATAVKADTVLFPRPKITLFMYYGVEVWSLDQTLARASRRGIWFCSQVYKREPRWGGTPSELQTA